jgi:hypothetical protein
MANLTSKKHKIHNREGYSNDACINECGTGRGGVFIFLLPYKWGDQEN